MIFIYRHGEKANASNCLSALGIVRGEHIGKTHARDECAFYTMAPVPPYKHIAPIQTASVACTVACKNLTVLPNYTAIPRGHFGRILVVVWYHGEIGAALDFLRFEKVGFSWPDDNHTGAIVVRDDNSWVFDPLFIHRPRYEQSNARG